MFIPIGDDIQKRIFPAVGVFLIVANVLVHVHSMKLWEESIPKELTPSVMENFDIHKTPWWKFTMDWGLVPADLAKGKTIGLGTHMFLHGDIFHLLGNMLVLWAFVGSLENALGSAKFLVFYLVWGLVAGAGHAAFMWGSKLPMIGASGAVAGMIGGYFVLFGALAKVKTLIFLGPRPYKVNMPAGIYVMIWLAFQFLGMEQEAKSGTPHVAYYAHLGGALMGAVTMFFFRAAVHSQLKVNAEGSLEFVDEPVRAKRRAEAPAEAAAAGAAVAVVARKKITNCPHCGTQLLDSHKMGESLWRCPGMSCQRLIY